MDYQCKREYMIGYGDVDYHNRCKLSAMMQYLQDVATMHSKEVGYGAQKMLDLHQGWLLISWQIEVKKYPVAEQFVDVRTWSKGIKGITATRDYDVCDKEGNTLLLVHSKWVLYDLEQKKMIKAPEEMKEAYGTLERNAIEKEESRLEVPEVYDEIKEYSIQRRDIDTNRHVNNVKYVELALETIPDEIYENKQVKEIEVRYKSQAFYKDTVFVTCTKRSENEFIHVVKSESGDVHAILKMLWE